MTRIGIDRFALRLHGVSAETARAAIAGLDAELLHRLNLRDLDASALRDLSPSIRLPPIQAGTPLDAESLRARIAEGLAAFLNAAVSGTSAPPPTSEGG